MKKPPIAASVSIRPTAEPMCSARIDYRPVATDGAARAASLLASLL